jgi:hypothetical protein
MSWQGYPNTKKFEEAKEVKKEMFSLIAHPASKETKLVGKKPLLLTKHPKKEPKDLDRVVKLVNKLSNKVVDLKNNVGEWYYISRPFLPFFKRTDSPPKPLEIPCLTLNLDDFDMDNLCSYHHQNHSKKISSVG